MVGESTPDMDMIMGLEAVTRFLGYPLLRWYVYIQIYNIIRLG